MNGVAGLGVRGVEETDVGVEEGGVLRGLGSMVDQKVGRRIVGRERGRVFVGIQG